MRLKIKINFVFKKSFIKALISGYKSEYVLSLMSKNNVWKKILY